MKIKLIPLAKLTHLADNPRKARGDLSNLKASIHAFGLFKPMLLWGEQQTVIGGNMRLQALHEMVADGSIVNTKVKVDPNKIPCVEFQGTLAEAKAVALRDNNDDGEWDYDKLPTFVANLATEFGDAPLTGLTGFDARALADLQELAGAADVNLQRFTGSGDPPDGAEDAPGGDAAEAAGKGGKKKKPAEDFVSRQFAKFRIGNVSGNLPIGVYHEFVQEFDAISKAVGSTDIHTILQYMMKASAAKRGTTPPVTQ